MGRAMGALCAVQAVIHAHAAYQHPDAGGLRAAPLAPACNPGSSSCDLHAPQYCACCEICRLCFEDGLTCSSSPCPCQLSTEDTLCDCSRFCCGAPCGAFASPASCTGPGALGCAGIPSLHAQCLCRPGFRSANGSCVSIKRMKRAGPGSGLPESTAASVGRTSAGRESASATGGVANDAAAAYALNAALGPGPQMGEASEAQSAPRSRRRQRRRRQASQGAAISAAAPQRRLHDPPFFLSGGRGAHHFRGDNATEVSVTTGGILVHSAMLSMWRLVFLPASVGVCLIGCVYVGCKWHTRPAPRSEGAGATRAGLDEDNYLWNTVEEADRLLVDKDSAGVPGEATSVRVLDERDM